MMGSKKEACEHWKRDKKFPKSDLTPSVFLKMKYI
jgi:hypothetical protein